MYINWIILNTIMTEITETKKKLLEKAIELIWKSSYKNVGVNEICKQAGVTKGSFYHYFESKAQLFKQASEYHWQNNIIMLDEVFSPRYSPLEQLENLINFLIQKQEKSDSGDSNPVSGCPIFSSASQVGSGEEEIRETGMLMSSKATKYNESLIRNLSSQGCLQECDINDHEQTARLLYQYVQGLLLYGRVFRSLDIVKKDIRIGIYRIIGLKTEYYTNH
jgi:TetR/AcrR family transcriptional repressor of nem operon